MPANLNALIRYKTINSCLYGGKRKWTLQELIEKCSEALAEFRGRYKPVSERTLRDDIRVMRSEVLGFNAPIKQLNGLYFYDDHHYSIMSVSFSDSGLIIKVIKLLKDIRNEVSHPELEIILEKLTAAAGREFPAKTMEKVIEYSRGLHEEAIPGFFTEPGMLPESFILQAEPDERELPEKGKAKPMRPNLRFSLSAGDLPCWGDVMGLLKTK